MEINGKRVVSDGLIEKSDMDVLVEKGRAVIYRHMHVPYSVGDIMRLVTGRDKMEAFAEIMAAQKVPGKSGVNITAKLLEYREIKL